MPIGPGKYDDLCTYVRTEADAHTAIVMVIHGRLGSGFSVQSRTTLPPQDLAAMLRDMADQIEECVQ